MEERKKIRIRQATKHGYIYIYINGIADLSYPNSKTRRGRVIDMGDTSPTLTAQNQDICKIEESDSPKEVYRIRKLTTRETGRLMCFNERDIDKQLDTVSNTQAYKQDGNSICKCVLMAIFSQMGIKGVPKWNDLNDFLRYLIINGSDEKWYQAEERGAKE